jgi:putative FmdB family regulatory protein
MPLYEYACHGCGEHLEVKQSFADPPLTVHSDCGGELRRVLQPVGIVFKGSGWYITDNRSTPSDSST